MTRRFLSQCLILSLPILALVATVLIIDPYNRFGTHGPLPVELKKKNLYHVGRTMPFSNLMWEIVEYRREPVPNILLGDSRLSFFDVGALQRTTGDTYYNLGVPGGNYRTMYDMFRFADSLTTLKNVYVQVSFRGMAQGNDYDLYQEPRTLLEHPQQYVFNRRVLESTALGIYSWVLPGMVEYDKLPPNQWELVLGMERENMRNFKVDSNTYRHVRYIADRCRAIGANLVLVEYPTHPDLQRLYAEGGLGPVREAYFEELRSFATVIDLDRPGLFPTDRGFWRDPLHLTAEAQRQLIAHVWGSAEGTP